MSKGTLYQKFENCDFADKMNDVHYQKKKIEIIPKFPVFNPSTLKYQFTFNFENVVE